MSWSPLRSWLLEGQLREPVADAILESLPPYGWSEIARKTDNDAPFAGRSPR